MALARRGFRRALHHSSRIYQDPFLLLTEDSEEYAGTPLTHVYFALDHEAAQIKVGITIDLDNRLRHLAYERGHELDLLGSLRGGYDLERAMHGRFAPYRVEGREWYSSEIIPDVAQLLGRPAVSPRIA